jgi:hypothetical protein
MIGDYVMTQHECQGRRIASDPVGLAAYTMDSHNVQRYVHQGSARNEGDVQVGGFPPYPIAFGSLLPRQAECRNLLVPVCLSASHIAFGSIRMEPVFMVLGQSAATAACIAIESGVDLHDIDRAALSERLRADGQVLAWHAPRREGVHRVGDFSGIVLDDRDAELKGSWHASTSALPYFGSGYLHDADARSAECRAVFRSKIERAGRYRVSIAYAPHPNRASAALVLVEHAGGTARIKVDQRRGTSAKEPFLELGVFRFERGATATVTISGEGADGHVIVDALRLEPMAP